MRESYVESRLTTEVKKRGGLAVKFVSPGLDGVPDRLVLFPGGRLAFVEMKAPGKKMSVAGQESRAAPSVRIFRLLC